MTAEQLAKLFHGTYERLAPSYGYKTRPTSAKAWEAVPARNRDLMVATCAVVLRKLGRDEALSSDARILKVEGSPATGSAERKA